MGMTTPFPEPDSPELERFAVRSEAEIVGLLGAMQEHGAPLSAFVDSGSPFGVVTLLHIDEAARELVFVCAADEAVFALLPVAPLVTFVGFVDSIKVQFAVAGVRPAGGGDRSTLAVPIPAQVYRLQRRTAVRVRPETGRSAVCRIPVPGGTGEREALRVLDISTGGIAVLAYPERFEPMVGSEIDDCRLDLPGVGGAVISVRVQHVGPLPGDKLARYCGFEFVRMAPAVQSMLARFINDKRAGAS